MKERSYNEHGTLPGQPSALRLAAATAAVLGAAGLAPAMAGTPPSMTANHGSVNIAIQGPNNSLKFYWAVNGTTTWHAETVAGRNTTYSAPSMTVNGNVVNIAAMGPDHRLRFYWAVNGTPPGTRRPSPAATARTRRRR